MQTTVNNTPAPVEPNLPHPAAVGANPLSYLLNNRKTIIGVLLLAVAVGNSFYHFLPAFLQGALMSFGVAFLGVGFAAKVDKGRAATLALLQALQDLQSLVTSTGMMSMSVATGRLSQGMAEEIKPMRARGRDLAEACSDVPLREGLPPIHLNASLVPPPDDRMHIIIPREGASDLIGSLIGSLGPSALIALIPKLLGSYISWDALHSQPKGFVQVIRGVAKGVRDPIHHGDSYTINIEVVKENDPKTMTTPGPAAGGGTPTVSG